MKFFSKLKAGLTRTRSGLMNRLGGLFASSQSRRLDELLDELEEILIQADIGPVTAMELVEAIRKTAGGDRDVNGLSDLKGLLAEAIATLESSEDQGAQKAENARPCVVFLVGVNGGGKTTTAAKLAARFKGEGKKVVLAAADTFRAAAIEQLAIWAERVGVDLIRHQYGADPSAVVFDALHAGRSRNADYVIVDTAGRLHTKTPLMKELEKIYRIAGREVEGAPHESLLVIDANTGQNGLSQAKEFLKAGHITGLVLTKLDGTAKGGIAVGVSRTLGIPLRYIGVGEAVDDLLDFSLGDFIEGLLAGDEPGSAAGGGLDAAGSERA